MYVLCPPGRVTGGPEALHQLAHTVNALGFDARMTYVPSADGPVPAAYRHYGVPVDQHVLDAPDTVVVAPETLPHKLVPVRHARRVLWWLSVDNALAVDRELRASGEPSALGELIRPGSRVLHVAQSEYARRHLADHGLRPAMLTDYLPMAFLQRAAELRDSPKFDVVLYNPAKGIEFTRRLIEASRGRLTWVPIEGLAPAEVAELLAYSKVYVDFGEHPGRDRIPREAAVAGCCVITGRRGAAGNGVDLPIPDRYVFDESADGAVQRIVDAIADAIDDFPVAHARFAPYRDWILGQQAAFTAEVARLLRAVRPPSVRRAHRVRARS